MLLLCGGALFAYRTYKLNGPQPVWIPLPIHRQLSDEKRDELIKNLKTKLAAPEILVKVSKDVGLMQKWHLASDEEGARVIGERLFVKAGEADTPLGKVPSINIGVNGKAKESVVSGEIMMRLINDVWKILGIDPPPKKGS